MTFLDFLQGFTPVTVILLIAGIGLMILEMITPGFGLAGISSICCLVLSIVLRARVSFSAAVWMTALVLLILGILLIVFFRSITKGSISRSPIVLNDSIQANGSYISSSDLGYYLDKEGRSLSALRPTGTAEVEGVRLNVTTGGEFIPTNTPIRVVKVEGLNLIVAPADAGEQPKA